MNLFHSARLKLTGFYFSSLVGFCLLLTFGAHAFTTHELKRADAARRGAVHNLVQQYINNDNNEGGGSDVGDDNPPPQPAGDRIFANAQQRQSNVTNTHLDHDFLVLDAGLLIIGAFLSYWYAGRTLKPIEEVHEQQKRFTADASHELRTPLTSMKLENEVFLRQKTFSEADARDQIASNLEEVERLERLASNLLALNQYEQSGAQLQPVDINQTVNEIITGLRRSTPFKKTDFKLSVATATVQVDPESLRELLAILSDNAIKYGPKDGPIEITGQLQNTMYLLAVRDHGPGIAGEDLPHIFERMYRGDKAHSSKTPGHGIGLSLARQIARANGAQLTAGNDPSGGAVFTVHFTA